MKRLISLILSVVLLVGLATVGAVPASAASAFEPSEDMITLLKTLEGFDRYPRWDYSQWTVGYGTACPDEDLERLKRDGITEEEAEELLNEHLVGFVKSVNSFNDKYKLNMSQNQFDAVLLFTYNLGHSWMFRESNIRTALTNGYTGNDLMFVMGQWSHAGGEVLSQLVKRRMMEYNMYVNGVYSRTLPDNFCYVIYEMNGGEGQTDVQCYDSDLTDLPRVTPTKEGYTFSGWYTANSGGTKVTVLDASVRNMTLYARWTQDGETPSEDPSEEQDPGQETETMTPVTVTVTANDVNIRKGPGTNYGVAGRANNGDQLTITEVQTGSGYTWGKFEGGWIALMYTNFDEAKNQAPAEPEETEPEETEPEETEPEQTEPEETEPEETVPPVTEPETGRMGTVTGNELYIRSGAGTSYKILGMLMKGDRVEILGQKTVGSMTWGKIEAGWICMSYVDLDETAENEPETPEESETPEEPEITGHMGTVTGNELYIRSGAGTSYKILGMLMKGDRVEILEQKTVGSMTWGKIEAGWICMTYVDLDEIRTEPETPEETEPEETEPEETVPPATEPETETDSIMGTVNGDELRIRSGAGTSYKIVGMLMEGDRVEILEMKTVNGDTWGRIEKGWVSLRYVDLDETEEEPEEPEEPQTQIVTVNTSCLRVRSQSNTTSAIVGYLYRGAKVEVLEIKTINGAQWGRISNGWIAMEYVK